MNNDPSEKTELFDHNRAREAAVSEFETRMKAIAAKSLVLGLPTKRRGDAERPIEDTATSAAAGDQDEPCDYLSTDEFDAYLSMTKEERRRVRATHAADIGPSRVRWPEGWGRPIEDTESSAAPIESTQWRCPACATELWWDDYGTIQPGHRPEPDKLRTRTPAEVASGLGIVAGLGQASAEVTGGLEVGIELDDESPPNPVDQLRAELRNMTIAIMATDCHGADWAATMVNRLLNGIASIGGDTRSVRPDVPRPTPPDNETT